MPDRKDDPRRDLRQPTNSYVRYSGLAFQMLGTIVLFTYAGYRLDQWLQPKVPVWTLVLSLVSIAGSLYLFIRGLPKNP
jgi:hypothetical protein